MQDWNGARDHIKPRQGERDGGGQDRRRSRGLQNSSDVLAAEEPRHDLTNPEIAAGQDRRDGRHEDVDNDGMDGVTLQSPKEVGIADQQRESRRKRSGDKLGGLNPVSQPEQR